MTDPPVPAVPPAGLPAVLLSTASVFPEPTTAAFAAAADLGYDGVELMVQTDPVSQDGDRIAALSEHYGVPVGAVHSPCLLITARVWGTDPLVKLSRSIDLAERVGADVVVVHPPFLWQRAAAGSFTAAVAELQRRTDVRIAVENMFPLWMGGQPVNSYRPHWNPVSEPHRWFTLDVSHTAVSRTDVMGLARQMAGRLAHVHLADGTGAGRDEHLVPGRGDQPAGELLEALAGLGFAGAVAVEVSTRGRSHAERELDLAEALSFARLHLSRTPVPFPGAEPGVSAPRPATD
ncbi:sugar phosphate isomerase/epimerase family protein [Nakamurella leprariae]|uniref:Sugar phosphate isomerase/epimerase n=1 Tax=Nakamurella leprariae TaxID=2803911 RepID=A0A939BVH4_9ACTN|nr:sugar phosphate isomerase/epimerase [Nakamurella leprariae]MBM9466523.1 sugar phosphate isomerase/epimerase [Nakamurella leprariae]